jgi:hypothetical protein
MLRGVQHCCSCNEGSKNEGHEWLGIGLSKQLQELMQVLSLLLNHCINEFGVDIAYFCGSCW